MHALGEPKEVRVRRLWWSHFRRGHQAQAQRCHRDHRATQAPYSSARLPQPTPLRGLPPLTDASWEQLRLLLPPQKPPTGRPAVDHRLIVEGMLWIARTSSSWRELPGRYGPWSTVASRYQRWWKEGLWMRIVQILLAPDNAPSPASPP
jgi:hypothetical protein